MDESLPASPNRSQIVLSFADLDSGKCTTGIFHPTLSMQLSLSCKKSTAICRHQLMLARSPAQQPLWAKSFTPPPETKPDSDLNRNLVLEVQMQTTNEICLCLFLSIRHSCSSWGPTCGHLCGISFSVVERLWKWKSTLNAHSALQWIKNNLIIRKACHYWNRLTPGYQNIKFLAWLQSYKI